MTLPAPDTALLQHIERLTYRAQPARIEQDYDGWRLRMLGGYTGRANSVNPVFDSTLPVSQKIDHCEAFYISHHLPPRFRLNDASIPATLDHVLSKRGYSDAYGHTLVCTTNLHASDTPATITIRANVDARWHWAYTTLNSTPAEYHDAVMEQLSAIVPQACFASIERDGEIIAVGLGVCEEGWLGIFDVVVSQAQRRNGHGERIVRGLMQWGASHGADRAYLQVLETNTPARRLYDRLGYQPLYRYWYRRLDAD